MGFKQFQTPHCHVQSLDTGATPEDFAARAVKIGAPGLTCTDHGTVNSGRRVYDLAKENNLIPILGLEAYFRDDNCPILAAAGIPKNEKGKYVEYFKYGHLTMHALDQQGFEAIVRLLSKADERAEKHGAELKPLFDWNNLEELGSYNITMTTGCLIGIIPRMILDHDNLSIAVKYLDKLKSIVKPGNLYTEIFSHDCSRNWVQGVFLTLADGKTLKFYDKKKLLTNVGEIQADALAKAWKSANNEHKILKSVKDRSTWRDMPEFDIVKIEHIEDFIQNECRDWAEDGDVQAGINKVMKILAQRNGLKILPSDDSHYANPDQSIVQEVRLAQSGNWKFWGKYHLMTSDEAFPYFQKIGAKERDFEEWIENSYEFTDRFKDFKFDSPPSLPKKFFEIEYKKRSWYKEGATNNSLQYLFELIKKHGRMDWKNKVYTDRLQNEVKLLHQNGTIDLLPYFFTMEEACDVYSKAGQLTGPGRGSAAGVLISYLLGITHVDPIRYNLSLERFITLDRIASKALPDIDQDLTNRDLLIPWLNERFPEHWAQISADVTIKLKSAVRDVARAVRGSVDGDIEGFAKKFLMPPQGVEDYDFIMGYDNDEGHIQGSVEYDPELKAYIKRYPSDWEIVQKCLGLARGRTRHASGILISDKPVSDFIPLTTVGGVRVTAYTATSVEAVGGIKYDFLNLNSLSDLSDCLKLIQKRSGVEIPQNAVIGRKSVPPHRIVPRDSKFYDIWDLPEDQEVFKDVSLGKTETVFQFSTPGAIKWLRHFSDKKPNGHYGIDSIYSMACFTALDRPGPLDVNVTNPDTGHQHNILVEYARRARGNNPTEDLLPIFNELLPKTHGLMIYQEDLQYMYQNLVGCSGSEAEEFRRNVAKKKLQKLEKAYGPFIERAGVKIGIENAKGIWEFFIAFGKYGFNLSHSVSYAIIAYACAYLKHYYPLEWWCSVLKNASKNEVNENFWRHAGHLIDLPDIKTSGTVFEIQGKRIRAPLDLLKGVGEGAHEQINKYRPYTDIMDFCRKMEQHKVDTGTISDVIKTRKDTANKVIDPETGKKKSVEVEYMVKQLKKGSSAINRGVMQKLIISGTMDSLFPEGMHLGEQLAKYEECLAEAANEVTLKLHATSGEVKKPKLVKVEPVDPKVWDMGPLRRYMLRKEILPAYGMDLTPFVKTEHPYEMVNASRLAQLQEETGWTGTVATVAYIDMSEFRKFNDKKTNELKEMCKVVLDIESTKFEFVRWSNREGKVPDMFKTDLKGNIAIVVLNRYKPGKTFSIEDFIVVERPQEVEPD